MTLNLKIIEIKERTDTHAGNKAENGSYELMLKGSTVLTLKGSTFLLGYLEILSAPKRTNSSSSEVLIRCKPFLFFKVEVCLAFNSVKRLFQKRGASAGNWEV